MEYIPGLKKGLTITLTIVITLGILLLLYYNNSFFENKFTLSINEIDINARYDSDFREILLIKNSSTNYIETYQRSSDLFFRVPTSDKYVLDLKEYEVYDKFGHRESYTPVSGAYKTKEVTNSKKTMMVQRMGETIYNGEYKEDISDIINGEGRYYFHIYVKSKRKSSPVARVDTSLHFSVLVVNDYES